MNLSGFTTVEGCGLTQPVKELNEAGAHSAFISEVFLGALGVYAC